VGALVPLAGDAAAVELAGVTKSYGRGRRAVMALDGVSAVFAPGSLSAVMGLSGSGKSTLLQMAAGLDRPTSGTDRLGGSDLSGLSGRRLSVLRRRRVGFVFQDLNLVPSLSVAENIALPLRLDHKPVDKSRIRELAGLVGIDGLLPRLPHTLSGGQQQRVAIARALVTHDPAVAARADRVLVLDQGRLAGAVSSRTAAELTMILRRLGEQGAR